jgi:hypothetical protein
MISKLLLLITVGALVNQQALGYISSSHLEARQQHFKSAQHLKTTLPSTALLQDGIESMDLSKMQLSGLQGRALVSKEYPSLSEVKAAMPLGTFDKDTGLSLRFAAFDVFSTFVSGFLGIKYLLPVAAALFSGPILLNKAAGAALWILYSTIVGTCGIAMWVTAHECGHGAFSDNKRLQDFIGYTFHSLMLVPYYSWQRSHAVHHANTNHAVDGETHVPPILEQGTISGKAALQSVLGKPIGEAVFGTAQLIMHLLVGWPAYLLFGATGGTSRGLTNHFLPFQVSRPGSGVRQGTKLKELFPGSWKVKVFQSDFGVATVLAGLYFLSRQVGLDWVAAAYGGPLLAVNAWLVLYTWLHHTEVDIPHLAPEGFSFIKGAFHTVDRPYNKILWGSVDFLHHHIGSTHGQPPSPSPELVVWI